MGLYRISADFATNINSYQSSVNENRYTTGAFFELDKMYPKWYNKF